MEKDMLIHDLKNALYLVDLNVRNIQENSSSVKNIKTIIEKSRKNIRQTLGSTKPPFLTDFSRTVLDVLSEHRELFKKYRASLNTSIKPGIFTKVQNLEKVVENLVFNSLVHGSEFVRVYVSLEPCGTESVTEVEFKIRDSGPGILEPREGLGLLIVKDVLQKQNINLDMSTSESGTTFSFRIPLLKPSKKRVLVIDDDEATSAALSKLLYTRGHEVITDPGTGLNSVSWDSLDVVILDYTLSEKTGKDILVSHGGSGPVFVILTGHQSEQLHDELMNLGSAEIFYKPLVIEDLLNFINYS